MRIAVIDLGTNTFNLLIADILPNRTFKKIYNKKIASKLGRGGINSKTIVPEAFQRGIDALTSQKETIDSHNCDKTFAIATSAIRNAENGKDFVRTVREQIGIDIETIPGEREAELIYKGNIQATRPNGKVLILDIGGGSNEFIIADAHQIFWKQSFEIGMQRLLQLFSPNAPMSSEVCANICNYADSKLQPLFDALKQYPTQTLIGSSGSFDTFRNLIQEEDTNENFKTSSFTISIETFKKLHSILVGSTDDELAQLKGIDLSRIEFLPTASIFVNYIVDKLNITEIIQSAYSLKEGVISEVIDKEYGSEN